MGKVFTILNLLTFDSAKYMEYGDLCSGAWTDCIYSKYRLCRRALALSAAPSLCARQEAQTDTLHVAHALEHAMIV